MLEEEEIQRQEYLKYELKEKEKEKEKQNQKQKQKEKELRKKILETAKPTVTSKVWENHEFAGIRELPCQIIYPEGEKIKQSPYIPSGEIVTLETWKNRESARIKKLPDHIPKTISQQEDRLVRIREMCMFCRLGQLKSIANDGQGVASEDLVTVCQYGDLTMVSYFLIPGVEITEKTFEAAAKNENIANSDQIKLALQIAQKFTCRLDQIKLALQIAQKFTCR